MMTEFTNILNGQKVQATDWQLAMKVGDHYTIEGGHGVIYGQLTSEVAGDNPGFFWAQGFSVHCPEGEAGMVCIVDFTRQITAQEFEDARGRGWRPADGQDAEGRSAIVTDFLKVHAVPLAARAWQGYLKVGRGVLIIRDDKVEGYAPGATFIAQMMQQTGPELPLFDEISKYDPNISFVLYFSRTGWPAAVGQKVFPMVPPPAAASPQTYSSASQIGKKKAKRKRR